MTQPSVPQSLLRIYSLGKAAVNKDRSTNLLRVIPIEHLTLLDGEMTSNPREVEVEGEDSQGQHYNSAALTDITIEADWLPMGPGYQQTAPDIRRDERVILWRFSDSDQYYWTPLGFDNHLRKLETVSFMFSGTSDETDEELSPDNSYVFTISTHEGHLTLTTSKANEEATAWAMQFNTKDGRFLLTEENGNEVEIDGVNSYISLTNADNSKLELDKRDIRMSCDDNFTLTAGQTITLKTKTARLECDTLTVVSQSNTFETPQSTFTGNVSMQQLTATSASIGGVTIQDGVLSCQVVNASQRVNAPNV